MLGTPRARSNGLAFALGWGRPKAGEEPPMPKWMQAIDTFTTGKSLGFGAVDR